MKQQIADNVYAYCQSSESISSLVDKESSLSPRKAASRLFGGKASRHHGSVKFNNEPSSEEELNRALQCGKWGDTSPSPLFLQAFHDALCCLNADPMHGVVSPPLMGSHGKVSLTMIAPLVELTHHCANAIARAEKEVVLVTCSWSASVAAKILCDAFAELSKRATAREQRICVKIIIGNPGPAHLVHNYQDMTNRTTKNSNIQLPISEDLPNLDVEIVSVHKPLLGTLHAKFVIIDRELAIVQSNNIEDNCNLEMLTHLEGPIVDSIYDYALTTFHEALKYPSPPSLSPVSSSSSRASTASLQQHSDRGLPNGKGSWDSAISVSSSKDECKDEIEDYDPSQPFYAENLTAEVDHMESVWLPTPSICPLSLINQRLNETFKARASPFGPEISTEDAFKPYILHDSPQCPMALVGRKPHGGPGNHDLHTPQNAAWLSCIRNAKSSVFIQTPDLNASPLLEAIPDAVKRGVNVTCYVCLGYNDPGELMPGQGGTNESFSAKLHSQLSSDEHDLLHIHWYVAKDQREPLHHSLRQRSCHLKLLIADGHVGIQGSGNMDTQSWAHSQEINVLVDSEEICTSWRQAIERNQNTARFGRGSKKDGLWRDKEGNEAFNSTPNMARPISWAVGAKGLMKKAQEKGGFA